MGNHRADGKYTIFGAQVENRNNGRLILKLSIRLTNLGRSDLGFWSESFRLLIDDVRRGPTSRLNTSVDAGVAKDAEITFDVPETARTFVLSIGDEEDRANIPLVLKKSG